MSEEPRGVTGEGLDSLTDAARRLPWSGNVFDPFATQVMVECAIRVNGQDINVRQLVDALAWQDPQIQEIVKEGLRQKAALEVVKKFPPVVRVHT